MACFREDLDACLAYLQCPLAHHRSIRTTNLLERSFVEERRRTKIIPGFFTEKSALKLVFGTLLRVQRRWQRVKMGVREQAQLQALRKKLGIVVKNQSEAA